MQRRKFVMVTLLKSGIQLQQDVLDEFAWDPQLDPADVGVEVDAGVVTLTGTVDSYVSKIAAERAAKRVDGVRAIANNITVRKVGAQTDTDIAKAAATAVEANSLLPVGAIDITVNNGKVTLTGQVSWEYQRTSALNTVQNIAGVRDVLNLLTIEQPSISPVEIKSGIERALVRAAELDADHIHVRGEDGHVWLTGTVHTWAAKQAAADAAWRAKGVTRVTNEIEVHAP
jgi:osmotically-inducible protein OsmY